MTAPPASSPAVRRRMQATSRRDTRPELQLRSALHRLGLRYRVDVPVLPDLRRRRADVVFRKARVAVFVDGCFWHGCPQHGNQPRTNPGYWEPKIARNRARDADTTTRLTAAGWHVIRAWEHEEPAQVAVRVHTAVQSRRATGTVA